MHIGTNVTATGASRTASTGHYAISDTTPRGMFAVEVLIDGVAQSLYRRRPDGRAYVVGPVGESYTLRMTNLTDRDVVIVAAVDHRNPLTGGEAHYDGQGMFIPARSSSILDGWRLNHDKAGKFVFANPADSVAAQVTETIANVGVIGFALFEKQVPQYQARDGFENYGDITRGGGGVFGGVGTGIGETIDSKVREVDFKRVPGGPAATLEIGYNTQEWLAYYGFITPAEPPAFPVRDNFTGIRRV